MGRGGASTGAGAGIGVGTGAVGVLLAGLVVGVVDRISALPGTSDNFTSFKALSHSWVSSSLQFLNPPGTDGKAG